jgi:predicted secreted hydrolase
MRIPIIKISVWLLAFLILGSAAAVTINREDKNIDANLITSPFGDAATSVRLRSQDGEGFQRAEGPIALEFPEDHGPHPEFQTEWWYYTGNLDTENGRHFGYQLTFFRRALAPNRSTAARSSRWATNQVYMAHFALTDVQEGHFYDFERFSREALGLAGAQPQPFGVWLNDWQVKQIEPGHYRLQAVDGDLSIDLFLTDIKGPVLHGHNGYSQKGPDSGNASYYISQTRLQTSGRVRIEDQEFPVSGSSWMDHEYSTSALSRDQIGWDWFSVQLNEDTSGRQPVELMIFQIRRADGTIDPFSSGTLILPDGSTADLGAGKFEINVLDTWRSPRTGGEYPAGWSIVVASEDLTLEIEPYLADQELDLTFDYWEGAVKIRGTWDGQPVSGNGYVELTGYAGSMAGEF